MSAGRSRPGDGQRQTYILVAGIGKDDDGQRAQRLDWPGPLEDADVLGIGMGIGGKVVDDQHDEVPDRDQGDEAGVLERVQPPQKAQGYDEEHKGRYPKMPVDQVGKVSNVAVEA